MTRHWLMIVPITVALFSRASATASDVRNEFASKATWEAPRLEEVRKAAFDWLDAQQPDAAQRQRVEAAWNDGGEVLDLLAVTYSAGEPAIRDLVARIGGPPRDVRLPEGSPLNDDKLPPIVRNNLRLLYGRWLVQHALYDEALEQLDGLSPADVADPASLLFCQAIVYQRTLNRERGLQVIERLLERSDIPRRYASVARLMQADLEGLKDESLDHIARRMDDVRRRLDLGRAGPKVREVEDGVIASLDKLIEELEKQQQQAAAAAAAAQGSKRSSSPAPDSIPLGGKGEGKVTQKNIGNQSGWGDLPPKRREEAMQQIGKDFPAHYRDMVEQYFRKLATESDEK